MREGLQKIVSLNETVVAIATPLGRSALGIVRISGSEALSITSRLFKARSPLEHHRVSIGIWLDFQGEPLDEVVVTFAQAPNSYTGDDLIEITGHGNPFVLNRILQSIHDSGARLASPGEFTLRAVAHGRIDLVQAEAIREFIDAQTEQQARTALRQIGGVAAKRLVPVKNELVDLIARLEAGIDFAEDDVDVPNALGVTSRMEPMISSLTALQKTYGYGRLLVEGLRITILGKPNVGKSSLFNKLVSAERAIVTEIPGTTRDVVVEAVNLNGIPLRLADTAGVRDTSDPVELIGVTRSLEELAEADLTLVVVDGSAPLDDDDVTVMRRVADVPHLIVVNKCDLPACTSMESTLRPLHVSAKLGTGIDELRDAISEFVLDHPTEYADDFVLTNARHNEAVGKALEALKSASAAVQADVPHEMVLLDLYGALSALNELTGETVTDDILDRIFSTFCIGK